MADLEIQPANTYTVVVQPITSTTVTINEQVSSVIVDNNRQGPPGVTFPLYDTEGQVLATHGSGNIYWFSINTVYVNTSQLSSNLTNYQTTIGLSSNVITLAANSAIYLGGNTALDLRTYADNKATQAYTNAINYSGAATQAYTNAIAYVDGKSYVNTSQLSSNLTNYQTTIGLSSNVITLAANSAIYLGGNTASDLRTYSDTKAATAYSNAITYSGNAAQAYSNAIAYSGNAAQAYSNATAYADTKAATAYSNAITYSGNAALAYSNAIAYVDGKSYVNTSQLSSNLYHTTNVATITSNYSMTTTDGLLLINNLNPVTLTLPTSSSMTGKAYNIKNINTGIVTILTVGNEKIDSYSNVNILYKNSMIGLRSTGSGWIIY